MRIETSETLSVAWLAGKFREESLWASLIVKGSFAIRNGLQATSLIEPDPPTGDILFGDALSESLRYPSDFVPFKPRADILLVGTGYSPAGQPVHYFPVRLKIANCLKTLDVIGSRMWESKFFWKKPGRPQLILKLPLTYENSWGGKDYKKNPLGRGRDTLEMHNIELPHAWGQRRRALLEPAGFGPLPASWEPRKSMVGNYKGRWLKDRWPWFPGDFNWNYFNAAPADQQIEGYLRGDEELEFENLHPKHQIYKSRLPGLRTRCFFNERLQNGALLFREVRMNLDTLWINMDEELILSGADWLRCAL